MQTNNRPALPEESGCFEDTKRLKKPLHGLTHKISPFGY
jgi:hypothetical protein